MHTHQGPSAYYVPSWSDVVRRDEFGEATFDSRAAEIKLEPGQTAWLGSL